MEDLKFFMFNILLILIGVVILLLTTLLFELDFIKAHISRVFVVYILMLLEFFVFGRIIYLTEPLKK